MNKKLLIIALMVLGSYLFGMTEAKAGTIFMRNYVEYNVQSGIVGGMASTYVTYDLYDYYDPWVRGTLYYTNPTNIIDGQGGEGVNDYLYFVYPGFKVTYTTYDYRPNKILCNLSDHRLRAIYQPTPLLWSDPYQISSITPVEYETNQDLTVSSGFTENLTSGDLYPILLIRLCIQTPTVQSVTFETINSPVTNDNPISMGGGSRIFPDLDNPGDTANRRIVRVKASIGVPVQGVPVYFRNFDVDDPSDDTIIDPNGSVGNDNRGGRDINGNWMPQSAGTLGGGSAACPTSPSGSLCRQTDANGIAAIEFTTTMQPGDNFVIAAGTDHSYLSGMTVSGTGLQDSAGNQIQTSSGQARRTAMLTVWRKIHIEVDSMGTVAGNSVTGLFAATQTIGTSSITIPISVRKNLEPGRFQGGRLVSGSTVLQIEDNGTNNLKIFTQTGTVQISNGDGFEIFDDDDFNSDDTITGVDGDMPEDVDKLPETLALMRESNIESQNVYAAAYIQPDYIWANNKTTSNGKPYNDTNVTFTLNLPCDQFICVDPMVNQARDSGGDERDDFWIAYVLIGYQSILTEDLDPVTESANGGITSSTDFADDTTNSQGVHRGADGSVDFVEVDHDLEQLFPTTSRQTAPHEVGHQFGLKGDDLGHQFGIMNPNTLDPHFVNRHINIMRWRISSPGN